VGSTSGREMRGNRRCSPCRESGPRRCSASSGRCVHAGWSPGPQMQVEVGVGQPVVAECPLLHGDGHAHGEARDDVVAVEIGDRHGVVVPFVDVEEVLAPRARVRVVEGEDHGLHHVEVRPERGSDVAADPLLGDQPREPVGFEPTIVAVPRLVEVHVAALDVGSDFRVAHGSQAKRDIASCTAKDSQASREK
jgi:hypothetical protein